MSDFIIANMPTILVGAVTAAAILAIAVKMIKDKKSGKSSCGGGCGACPCSGACHKK